MIIMRELTEDEIKQLARQATDLGGFVDPLKLYKLMVEKAQVQQIRYRGK